MKTIPIHNVFHVLMIEDDSDTQEVWKKLLERDKDKLLAPENRPIRIDFAGDQKTADSRLATLPAGGYQLVLLYISLCAKCRRQGLPRRQMA